MNNNLLQWAILKNEKCVKVELQISYWRSLKEGRVTLNGR